MQGQSNLITIKEEGKKKLQWKGVSFFRDESFPRSCIRDDDCRIAISMFFWKKDTHLFIIPGVSDIFTSQRFKDILS